MQNDTNNVHDLKDENTLNIFKVFLGITDHLDPQTRAMLMAMYSRTTGSITDRIPELEDQESLNEKFGRFYVGYGHKSVGQLGCTDTFIESVSQLAAKAIENNKLYNGQESSTRYIDFSKQPMVNFGISDFSYWQEKFRDFYLRVLEATINMVKEEYPFEDQPEGTKQTVWENTIKARAFDICRGFLPAGVTTNVGISGTFDLYNDHFGEMLFHPSSEMRDIADKVLKSLKNKYEHAVDIEKLVSRNNYISSTENEFSIDYFYDVNTYSDGTIAIRMDTDILAKDVSVLFKGKKSFDIVSHIKRNKFEKYPKMISDDWYFNIDNFLDFGSYRDIHRHRNGNITMPLLTIKFGMHNFYKSSIPESFKSELNTLLSDYEIWYKVNSKKYSLVDLQYTVPMGYIVQFNYKCDLNQLIYLLELRTSKTVHQTLRWMMQCVYEQFSSIDSDIIKAIAKNIHVDLDDENFTLKRGTQTFNNGE